MRQVDVGRPGEGIGHDERRAGEVVGFHLRVNPALKVAVAREDRRHDEISLGDRVRHGIGQRTAVADAGRAAVADRVEPEGVQRLIESRLGEVFGDNAAPRREARLDPRLAGETLRDGIACEQPGSEHHRRIARVGAARDGRDDDGTVGDLAWLVALHRDRRGRLSLAEADSLLLPRGLHVLQEDTVLRAFWSRHRRDDGREIEFQFGGEAWLGGARRAEHALSLVVRLDQFDFGSRSSGASHEAQRFIIDGEEAHRRAVFGSHVGQRRAIGERHRLEAGAVELDELSNDAVLPQSLRHRENEVRRSGSFGELPAHFEADHFGHEHVDRLAEHDRFGFDSTDAPAHNAQSVDHRRVAVSSDETVWIRDAIFRQHNLREVFQIHLMHDPGGWRHDAEVA